MRIPLVRADSAVVSGDGSGNSRNAWPVDTWYIDIALTANTVALWLLSASFLCELTLQQLVLAFRNGSNPWELA